MTAETRATVTVSYVLSPPGGTTAPPSLAPNETHVFVVEVDKTAGRHGEYYEAVRKAISAAKEKLGEELTAWRDAVGSGEAGKEQAVKAARAEEGAGEEEEEEEEEE